MYGKIVLFFIISSLFATKTMCQTDPWPGTWQSQAGNVTMQLRIGTPEKNLLFPACISLQCDSFHAEYEVLLVKKSVRELAISRNKYVVTEKPFTLGEHTIAFTGLFDITRDMKGIPSLTFTHMQVPPASVKMPDSVKQWKTCWDQLMQFLTTENQKFSKLNSIPWNDMYSERIVSPSISPAYFGLSDTIYIPTRDAIVKLSSLSKSDIVSASLNGRTFIDQQYTDKKEHSEDVLLDTGLNILVLFAEDGVDRLVNKTKLILESGTKKIKLDFTRKDDSAAKFIAIKLYFEKDKNKDIYFQEYAYPGKNDKPLQGNQKLVGAVKAVSRQLTLALWDDAVEDGDSISININGEWIARGFAVKKNPQFITVTLKPGSNTITFVGDNLGSIPPNTSVLEIIDGKKRKSFLLETVPGEENLLKIAYDLKSD